MEKTFVTAAYPSPQPVTQRPVSSRPSDSSQRHYDSAVLEDISKQLAHYIGPIAKVVVKRASSSSNNLRELCDKVAAEIDSETRRKNFLVTVRKHLNTSGEI
jgi:serine/threonine-protein kinase